MATKSKCDSGSDRDFSVKNDETGWNYPLRFPQEGEEEEGKVVYVNRDFLGTISPVFRKIFTDPNFADSSEPELTMAEKNYEEFLEFINCVSVTESSFGKDIDIHNLWSMIEYAEEYQMRSLKKRCRDFICHYLKPHDEYYMNNDEIGRLFIAGCQLDVDLPLSEAAIQAVASLPSEKLQHIYERPSERILKSESSFGKDIDIHNLWSMIEYAEEYQMRSLKKRCRDFICHYLKPHDEYYMNNDEIGRLFIAGCQLDVDLPLSEAAIQAVASLPSEKLQHIYERPSERILKSESSFGKDIDIHNLWSMIEYAEEYQMRSLKKRCRDFICHYLKPHDEYYMNNDEIGRLFIAGCQLDVDLPLSEAAIQAVASLPSEKLQHIYERPSERILKSESSFGKDIDIHNLWSMIEYAEEYQMRSLKKRCRDFICHYLKPHDEYYMNNDEIGRLFIAGCQLDVDLPLSEAAIQAVASLPSEKLQHIYERPSERILKSESSFGKDIDIHNLWSMIEYAEEYQMRSLKKRCRDFICHYLKPHDEYYMNNDEIGRLFIAGCQLDVDLPLSKAAIQAVASLPSEKLQHIYEQLADQQRGTLTRVLMETVKMAATTITDLQNELAEEGARLHRLRVRFGIQDDECSRCDGNPADRQSKKSLPLCDKCYNYKKERGFEQTGTRNMWQIARQIMANPELLDVV